MSDPTSKLKAYGGFRPGNPLYRPMRHPFFAVTSHWIFQGLFYMDPAERWFKLTLDAVFTMILTMLFRRWSGVPAAIGAAYLSGHTINFLLNGHFWGTLKHFGYVTTSRDAYMRYQADLAERVRDEPSILFAAAYGSLSRAEWNTHSDLDVRLLRANGFWNAFRASAFALKERSRAMLACFPLDLYVMDSWQARSRPTRSEAAVVLKRLPARYDKTMLDEKC